MDNSFLLESARSIAVFSGIGPPWAGSVRLALLWEILPLFWGLRKQCFRPMPMAPFFSLGTVDELFLSSHIELCPVLFTCVFLKELRISSRIPVVYLLMVGYSVNVCPPPDPPAQASLSQHFPNT